MIAHLWQKAGAFGRWAGDQMDIRVVGEYSRSTNGQRSEGGGPEHNSDHQSERPTGHFVRPSIRLQSLFIPLSNHSPVDVQVTENEGTRRPQHKSVLHCITQDESVIQSTSFENRPVLYEGGQSAVHPDRQQSFFAENQRPLQVGKDQ